MRAACQRVPSHGFHPRHPREGKGFRSLAVVVPRHPRLPRVDTSHGWLIFALPPAEMVIHPIEGPSGGGEAKHELYLMSDDVDASIAVLAA